MSENGWSAAEEFVRHELQRMADAQDTTNETLGHLREEVAALKVKAGMWGAAAGAIAALGFKVLT